MLKRIHGHWTAGADGINDKEHDSYNFLVDRAAKVIAGEHPPEHQTPENVKRGSAHYAAHTLNANSYAIGVSMDAMADAVERPFSAGKYPITTVQYEAFCCLLAALAIKYGITCTRSTILTHAEVQTTLKIKQNQKWDIMWLPGMTKPGDAIAVGDVIRANVQKYIDGIRSTKTDYEGIISGKIPAKLTSPVSVVVKAPTASANPTPIAGVLALISALAKIFKRGQT